MDANVCLNCGGNNFIEEDCELFCFNCGALNKVSSTQIAKSQDVVKATWSLLIKEHSKNVVLSQSKEKKVDKVHAYQLFLKKVAKVLSELTKKPSLYQTIGKLWIKYLNMKLDQCPEKFKACDGDEKFLYANRLSFATTLSTRLVLRICFLGLKAEAIQFTYYDLKLLILNNTIPYFNWFHEGIEGSTEPLLSGLKDAEFLETGDHFYRSCILFCHRIRFREFPFPDFDNFVNRFWQDFNFPTRVLELSCIIKHLWLGFNCKRHSSRFPFLSLYIKLEIYSMAILVISARLHFCIWWKLKDVKTLKSKSLSIVRSIGEEFRRFEDAIKKSNSDEFISAFFTSTPSSLYDVKSQVVIENCTKVLNSMKNITPISSENLAIKIEKIFQQLNSSKCSNKLTNSVEEEKDDKINVLTQNNVEKKKLYGTGFEFMTKPLRKVIYSLPCVLVDTCEEFQTLVTAASGKLAISKRHLLEIISDINWNLLNLENISTA